MWTAYGYVAGLDRGGEAVRRAGEAVPGLESLREDRQSGVDRDPGLDGDGLRRARPSGSRPDAGRSGGPDELLGRVSTVVDAAGRSRRSETDALGRVVSVVEAPGAEGYETSYTYDALDRLREVRQSAAQRRGFDYDTFGRLRSSSSPESGESKYEYDPVGNLTKRVDARGVVTTSEYDRLNRLRGRAYSNGTPPVRFTYDQDETPAAFPVGRLTAVETGPEGSPQTRTEYHHDAVGRVFASTQTTDGQTFAFQYAWNRAGELLEEVYPSGRTVETPRDLLGRLTAVTDTGRTLASGFVYSPHGALEQLTLANGLTEGTDFNLRLQPTCLALGPQAEVQQRGNCAAVVAAGSTSVPFALEWRYSPAGSPATVNNGNVWAQTTWLPRPGVPQPVSITQSYDYDWLNRLTSAVETGGWRQTYAYDRFGNRVVTPGTGGRDQPDRPEDQQPDAAPGHRAR